MSNQKDNFYNFASLIWLNQSQLFRNVVNNDSIVTGFFFMGNIVKNKENTRKGDSIQVVIIQRYKKSQLDLTYHKSSTKMTPT